MTTLQTTRQDLVIDVRKQFEKDMELTRMRLVTRKGRAEWFEKSGIPAVLSFEKKNGLYVDMYVQLHWEQHMATTTTLIEMLKKQSRASAALVQ